MMLCNGTFMISWFNPIIRELTAHMRTKRVTGRKVSGKWLVFACSPHLFLID